MDTRFSVFCTGFDDSGSHVEYNFHIVHSASGCAWDIRRRYSELLQVHEQLAGALHREEDALPEFPAKGLPGAAFFLGTELLLSRVSAFQQYFDLITRRGRVAGSPELQKALGVQPPKAVSAVRVRRWLPAGESQPGTAAVELDADVDGFLPLAEGSSPLAGRVECNAPVERLLARVKSASSTVGTHCAPPGDPIIVRNLPCGEELVVDVHAANGVGESEPVSIRLLAPGARAPTLLAGMRVKAPWAGNGRLYDAVVKTANFRGSGYVLVNWLRPAPLSGEKLTCVCDDGEDDTAHRTVPRYLVHPDSSDWYDDIATEAGMSSFSSDGQFRLDVRLGDEQVEQLVWQSPQDLAQQVQAFVATHRLKPLLEVPLRDHAELLQRTRAAALSSVDIVDLVRVEV